MFRPFVILLATAAVAFAQGGRLSTDAVPAKPRAALISSETGGKELGFLSTAYQHGQLQLYLGEQAKVKGQSDQVKFLGELLASSQAQDDEGIVLLAQRKGIALERTDAAAQKSLSARLDPLAGARFDKAWLEETVALHTRLVAAYEAATASGDGEVQAFAREGLPRMKEKLLVAGQVSGQSARTPQRPGFRTNVRVSEEPMEGGK